MGNIIPYQEFIENKINSVSLENRSILRHRISTDDDRFDLVISLTYDGFTVKLKYGDVVMEDYSFMEDENRAKTLIPKFVFPFSDIEYSVYDIHNTVDDEIFRTYSFHCLYDEEAVGKAIDTIIAFINRNAEKIKSISSSDWLQKKLNESFEDGLRIASKKITLDKIRQKPEKYLHSHDVDMYFLRFNETAFVSHITKDSTRDLNKFYNKHSKKDTLLPFEKRYIDYLFSNDFKNTDEETVESVKKNQKISKGISKADSALTIISLVLALGVSLLLGFIVENRLEENYLLLQDVTLDSIIPLVFMLPGFAMILNRPIKHILLKRKKGYDDKQDAYDKKINIILVLIGLILVAGTSTYLYFDYQKNVGLGENDVYYCQRLGKAETLSYDEVKLYLIEGTYYGDDYYSTNEDKTIVVVVNDDYEDCFVSDYLTEIDMPSSFRDSLSYAGKFKSIEDFNENFNID